MGIGFRQGLELILALDLGVAVVGLGVIFIADRQRRRR